MDDLAAAEEVKSKLSSEQKAGFVLLVIFAILAVGLGVLKIRNTIYGPMALTNEIPPLLNEAVNDPAALRFRDTDLDGLSDFDELYVYGTSAYLADSDSDGISDRVEVEEGKDPLCGEGQTCNSIVQNAGAVAIATNTLQAPETPDDLEVPVGQYGLNGEEDIQRLLTDADYIRQLLRQAGLDEDSLSKLTDEQLLEGVAKQIGQTAQTLDADNTAVPTAN